MALLPTALQRVAGPRVGAVVAGEKFIALSVFFMAAEHFAIHVVADEQKHICEGFARSGNAFDGLDWETSIHGVPLINNCLSRFECQTHATHDGGDHSIVVAKVLEVATRTGDPLLFFLAANMGHLRLNNPLSIGDVFPPLHQLTTGRLKFSSS